MPTKEAALGRRRYPIRGEPRCILLECGRGSEVRVSKPILGGKGSVSKYNESMTEGMHLLLAACAPATTQINCGSIRRADAAFPFDRSARRFTDGLGISLAPVAAAGAL